MRWDSCRRTVLSVSLLLLLSLLSGCEAWTQRGAKGIGPLPRRLLDGAGRGDDVGAGKEGIGSVTDLGNEEVRNRPTDQDPYPSLSSLVTDSSEGKRRVLVLNDAI